MEPGLDVGVPGPPGTAAGEWLALTVLPVSTAPDEHLIIRTLQACELVFGILPDMLRGAATSARAGRADEAVVRWDSVRGAFARRLPGAGADAAA